jgi:2-polyprenyl-6-methoxyphenol hydroxylase-like FAD-dependent oxidoreductase
MKRILVVGGGPAGLFFALMAQRSLPDAEVHVREQNPAGVTYGWGFGFTQSAIDALRPAAPDVIGRLEGNCPHDVMDMILNGEVVQVAGDPMHSNARWSLLEVLESAAVEAGVQVQHDITTEIDEAELDRWDLVIGADGVNSRTREHFAAAFEPSIVLTENWLAWYGTAKFFNPSIILEDGADGVVMAHASQFSDELSNFTVEVGQKTFDAMGFADMTEAESVAACQGIFEGYLDGNPLLANHSAWFQAKFVSCAHWTHRNLVLIGDALHTVHPSIGSGTRMAMRDAVYLMEALEGAGWEVADGLRAFEARRKPIADAFQAAARRSISWYEGLSERTVDDPVKFALEYIMRTGRIRYPDFRRANQAVIENYETQLG